MNDFIPILIVAGIIVVGIVLVIMLIQNLLIVVPPNKVLVISGRSPQTTESNTVGCGVIRGGRAFRIPGLEKVSWMGLSVENAYSRGGIPLKIHAVANVKINGSDPPILEEQNKLEVRKTELSATQNFEQEQAALEALLRQKRAEAQRQARVIEAERNAQAT